MSQISKSGFFGRRRSTPSGRVVGSLSLLDGSLHLQLSFLQVSVRPPRSSQKPCKRFVAFFQIRSRPFFADPADQTPFAESLDLAPGNHIQASWGAFMGRLAERVVVSLRQELMQSCSELCLENGWTDPKEGIAAVCEAFLADGLPTIGQRRAVLLCSDKAYEPDCESTRLLVADLILAVGLVAVTTSAEVTFNSSGDAILRFGDGRTATVVLRSGSGYRRWGQLEGLLANRGGDRPNLVVAGGFSQSAPNDVAPPVDIVDNEPTDDVAFGCVKLRIVSIDSLRSDLSNIVRELA